MALDGYVLYGGAGKQCIVIGADNREEIEVLVARLSKSRHKDIKAMGQKLQIQLSEENGKE